MYIFVLVLILVIGDTLLDLLELLIFILMVLVIAVIHSDGQGRGCDVWRNNRREIDFHDIFFFLFEYMKIFYRSGAV